MAFIVPALMMMMNQNNDDDDYDDDWSFVDSHWFWVFVIGGILVLALEIVGVLWLTHRI